MASDVHLTREILVAAVRGELPTEMVVNLVIDHLVAQCETCRDEIAAFMERSREEASEYDYGPVFERLTQSAAEQVKTVESEREKAKAERVFVEIEPRRHRSVRTARCSRSRASASLVLAVQLDFEPTSKLIEAYW